MICLVLSHNQCDLRRAVYLVKDRLYTEILTTAISASLKTDFFHVILIISIMTPAVVPIFRAILRIHIFTISSWLNARFWRLSWRTRSRCLCASRNGWLSCSTLKIVRNIDKILITALDYGAVDQVLSTNSDYEGTRPDF